MFLLRILLLLLSACACSLHAADEETRFKPKSYTPRKELTTQTYRAPAYTPSESARSTGTGMEQPRALSRWNVFKRAKPLDEKRLPGAQPAVAEAYKQRQQISVPTITADPAIAADNKPFETTDKKLSDLSYKPSDRPRDKNPLLAPRQGIKEPE